MKNNKKIHMSIDPDIPVEYYHFLLFSFDFPGFLQWYSLPAPIQFIHYLIQSSQCPIAAGNDPHYFACS